MKQKIKLINWPIYLMMLISFGLVYETPPEIIMKSVIFNDYLEFISKHIPASRNFISMFGYESISSIYFPIMILFTPLGAVSMCLYPRNPKWWGDYFLEKSLLNTFRSVIFLLLTALTFWVSFLAHDRPTTFADHPAKIHLALFGHIFAGSAFLGLVGVFIRIFSFMGKKETTKQSSN